LDIISQIDPKWLISGFLFLIAVIMALARLASGERDHHDETSKQLRRQISETDARARQAAREAKGRARAEVEARFRD
jgi:hypothetical protein